MNFAELYFRKKRSQLEKITDFRILFLMLVSVSAIILGIFVFALTNQRIVDSPIVLQPLDQALVLKTPQVLVNLHLKTFAKFDVVNDDFTAELYLRFTFDPTQIDQATIDNFRFDYVSDFEKKLVKEKRIDDHKKTVGYSVTIKFRADLDYRYFPLDKHRLNFVIINPAFKDCVFITDATNFSIDTHAFTKDWQIKPEKVSYGIATTANHEKQEVVFSADISRKSTKTVSFIFLPLFLIFFLGLLSLTFDVVTEFTTIFSLAVGSTTALIFYSNTLSTIVPLSGIFTLADAVYSLLLCLITVTFTIQIFLLHFYNEKQKTTRLKELLDYTAMSLNIVRSLVFLFFLVAMLIIVSWLLLS